MEWFVANWDNILLAITSIITAASVIVKMTPGKKDDERLNKIKKMIEILSLKSKDK